jgi:hypothetical protein
MHDYRRSAGSSIRPADVCDQRGHEPACAQPPLISGGDIGRDHPERSCGKQSGLRRLLRRLILAIRVLVGLKPQELLLKGRDAILRDGEF